ncbi:acyltransferase [Pseudomonas sp. BN415]|uniref:acyltransferase family protein n=1 Tax=Pseudomonas sp. BN415 TaxID=2567889 RepID=UPI0024538BB6|nr:acyltransferase [Pseudomonas sp. BN415]MDH4581364.1 acyltransferase [Pseudomonas sp. BN415]
MNKNRDIECFRAYAVIITFIAHLWVINPSWQAWTTYFWLGGGVDLFFCISGFLITTSLLGDIDAHESFRSFALPFWVRRAFRLWPAAIFWATATLLVSALFDVSGTLGSREDVSFSWLFGTLNVANLYLWWLNDPERVTPLWHYWSLSLEEQFYILVPLVLFLRPRRSLLVALMVLFAVYQSTAIRPWGSLLWFVRSDALLYGVLIAMAWHFHPKTMTRGFAACRKGVWQSLLLVLLPLPVLLAREALSPYYMGWVAISSAALVLLVSGNADLTGGSSWLRRLAIYIGARSYSIYLVHYPVLALVREAILATSLTDLSRVEDQVIAAMLAAITTIALAEFSYRFIETPLRVKGRHIAGKMARPLEKQGLGAVH